MSELTFFSVFVFAFLSLLLRVASAMETAAKTHRVANTILPNAILPNRIHDRYDVDGQLCRIIIC